MVQEPGILCWCLLGLPGTLSTRTARLISDDTLSKLRSLHESAILLGFLSAERERCPCYSRYGIRACWEMSPVTISRGGTLEIDEENATRRLFDTREDICLLYREINRNEGLLPASILTRVLTERGDGCRPGQLRRKLDSLMSKAEATINLFLPRAPFRGGLRSSFGYVCLLVTLAAYIPSLCQRTLDQSTTFFLAIYPIKATAKTMKVTWVFWSIWTKILHRLAPTIMRRLTMIVLTP